MNIPGVGSDKEDLFKAVDGLLEELLREVERRKFGPGFCVGGRAVEEFGEG